MELLDQFPEFHFRPDRWFVWSPADRTISYDPKRIETDQGRVALLHEIGHALLGHTPPLDRDRYQVERDAWDVARLLATKLGVRVPERYIARQLSELRHLGY